MTINIKDYDHIEGWFMQSDVDSVHHVVSLLPESCKLLEVGSYQGKSAVIWAETFKLQNKEAKIHCIDSFSGNPCSPVLKAKLMEKGKTKEEAEDFILRHEVKWWGFDPDTACSEDVHMQNFIANTERYGITWTKTHVKPLEYIWDGGSYDCIFYDADHSYVACYDSLKLWRQHLNAGGIMCVHDYDAQWQGTVDAVNQIFSDSTITTLHDDLPGFAIITDIPGEL